MSSAQDTLGPFSYSVRCQRVWPSSSYRRSCYQQSLGLSFVRHSKRLHTAETLRRQRVSPFDLFKKTQINSASENSEFWTPPRSAPTFTAGLCSWLSLSLPVTRGPYHRQTPGGSHTLFLSSLRGGNRETHLSARTGSTKTPKVCWDYCKTEKLSWKGKHPSGPNIGNPFCPLSFSGVHRLAGTSGEVVLLLSLTMSNSKQPLLATHCLYISGSTGPLVFTTWLFKHLEQ